MNSRCVEPTYEPAYGPPLPPDREDIAFRRRNARACDELLRRLKRFHPLAQ
jgi:hypothetical protein